MVVGAPARGWRMTVEVGAGEVGERRGMTRRGERQGGVDGVQWRAMECSGVQGRAGEAARMQRRWPGWVGGRRRQGKEAPFGKLRPAPAQRAQGPAQHCEHIHHRTRRQWRPIRLSACDPRPGLYESISMHRPLRSQLPPSVRTAAVLRGYGWGRNQQRPGQLSGPRTEGLGSRRGRGAHGGSPPSWTVGTVRRAARSASGHTTPFSSQLGIRSCASLLACAPLCAGVGSSLPTHRCCCDELMR